VSATDVFFKKKCNIGAIISVALKNNTRD